MFNFFKSRDKLGKQTQSADVHNPIMRRDDAAKVVYATMPEDLYYQAVAGEYAKEVARLSGLLRIHEARYAKQMKGLKKATAAAAEKRRKV